MPLTPLEAIQQLQDDADAFHDIVAGLQQLWTVLYHSAVPASHTGDLVETTLQDIVVPAQSMGINGLIRITSLWSYTNSANVKTLFTYFGGTGGRKYGNRQPTTTDFLREQIFIANRGAADSQVGHPAVTYDPFGADDGALVTSSIDTAQDQHLLLRCQLANAGETITLEECLVELLQASNDGGIGSRAIPPGGEPATPASGWVQWVDEVSGKLNFKSYLGNVRSFDP